MRELFGRTDDGLGSGISGRGAVVRARRRAYPRAPLMLEGLAAIRFGCRRWGCSRGSCDGWAGVADRTLVEDVNGDL
jgi:hypothetical protein